MSGLYLYTICFDLEIEELLDTLPNVVITEHESSGEIGTEDARCSSQIHCCS